MYRTAILFCTTGILSSTAFAADKDFDGHDDTPASAGATFDCDDNNASIYPGALDIPMDGIDQDCADGDEPWPYTSAEIEAFAGAHKGLSVENAPESMWNCEQGGGTISADATACNLPDDGMICDVHLTGGPWVVSTQEQCLQTDLIRRRSGDGNGLSKAETEAVQGMLDGLGGIYLTQEGFETYKVATEERLVGIEGGVAANAEVIAANAEAIGTNTSMLRPLFLEWETDEGEKRGPILKSMQEHDSANAEAIGTNATAIKANATAITALQAKKHAYWEIGLMPMGLWQGDAQTDEGLYIRGDQAFAFPASLGVGVPMDESRAGGYLLIGPSWNTVGSLNDEGVAVDNLEVGSRVAVGGEWLYDPGAFAIGTFGGFSYHASGGNPVSARTKGVGGEIGAVAELAIGSSDVTEVALFVRGGFGREAYATTAVYSYEPETFAASLEQCEQDNQSGYQFIGGGVKLRFSR